MAYTANELFRKTTRGPAIRIMPQEGSGAVKPKTFAPNGAASTLELPVGTPVAYNTSTNKWVPWVNAAQPGTNGTSTVQGFVYPDPVTIEATGGDDVLGQVMLRGSVHYDDVVEVLTGLGYTTFTTNLTAALVVGPRSLGLTIEGLANVR